MGCFDSLTSTDKLMSKNLLLLLALFSCFQLARAQSLSSFGNSNLPLVVINTSGQSIPDDPKIEAQMGIIWNGQGNMNAVTDDFNDYNGVIGIEVRGSTSQMFPKKSYGLELHDAAGEDVSASILGMPEEEDWILYAPYSDKTLIRNVLTMTLDASLGHYSPRCRFVELFLNNQYQGVYVMMEKIKRDKNRVDLSKLKEDDLTGEDLTGGYLLKIDKTTGSGGSGWTSAYLNSAYKRTFFQYEYPKPEDIQPAQKSYIQNYMNLLEKSLDENNFDGENGFRQLADEASFIDFFIINELTKNVDGYRLSTFLYKDKNEKVTLGPIWDFNLAYGNADYYNGVATSGFQFEADLQQDDWQVPFWWEILFDNNEFRAQLKERWSDLRAQALSDDRIDLVVDSLTTLLADAQTRNFAKWPVLDEYVWPNAYVGYSYAAEISWIDEWIDKRMSWLDTKIEDLYVGFEDLTQLAEVSVYPNPFKSELHIQLKGATSGNLNFAIYNLQGTKLLVKQLEPGSNDVLVTDAQMERLPAGIYLVRITRNDQPIYSVKIVKQ